MDADNQGPIRRILEIDRVIHEPARLAVMTLLSVVEEADFLFLLDETGLSRGNLSAHTSKLESAGFVSIEKTFVEKIPRTVYRITKEGETALEVHRRILAETLGLAPAGG